MHMYEKEFKSSFSDDYEEYPSPCNNCELLDEDEGCLALDPCHFAAKETEKQEEEFWKLETGYY